MAKNKNYLNLKKFCFAQGVDLFGVADIATLKKDFMLAQKILDNVDRAVCLGIRLSSGILEEIKDTPTRLYFHHYRTINALLDQIALKVSNYIQKKKFTAIPVPASQIVDWENQKAHLSHRKIGYLAALGWIGRNNLLVNKDLGSQFRIVTILTDMSLTSDKPAKEGCGDCRLCIKVCPAGAIGEKSLDFNYLKCFDKLKEFQKQRLVDQYICGVCVNVCRGK
jgi:epoxyqueuosine reductase QueG